MPNIQLSVPHKLGQDEAKQRITKLIAESREKFGDKVKDVQESWMGNVDTFSFKAMGFAINGQLDVQPSTLIIDINFPWAVLPFKGRLQNEILKHAQELLA